MPCNLTSNFVLDCKNSAGGISTVYIAPFSAMGNLSIVSGSVANTGSFLISGSGAQFFQYDLRKASSEASEDIKVSEVNGTVFYEPSCAIVLTKTEVLKRNEIALLAQQSVVIIVKDHTNVTGSYWMYGSQAGLELLTAKQQTGKAYGDLNGYTLTLGPGMEQYPHVSVPASLIPVLKTPA